MLNRDLRLGLRDWQWVGDGELAPRPARLELTGWPPAVLSDIYVEPANDNLTLTGHAPVVGVSQFVTPGEDALTLTGAAPGVLVDEVVFPDADTLALTGYAPTVTAGAGTNVEPGTDTLTITGQAPTPVVDQVPAPGTDTLVVTGYAPLAPASQVVTPGADTLSITEYAPTIDSGAGNTTVEPGTDTLTITGQAPAVGNDIPVANDTLIITEHAPNVSTDSLVAPGADSLVITGLTSLVSSDQIVAPGPDSLEITEYAPTPLVDQVLAPGVDSLIITEYAPTPVVSQVVAPAQDTLSIVELTPTISTTGGATTTHTLISAAEEYSGVNSNANAYVSAPNAGDLLVAIVANRGGFSHTTHDLSDDNSGTWTKVFGYDNEITDSNARHAISVHYRIADATDASGTVIVTSNGSDGDPDYHGLCVLVYRPSAAYTYSAVGSSANGTGVGGNDLTTATSSGSTASITGSDLFVLSVAVGRKNGASGFSAVSDVGFSNATEDYGVTTNANNNEMTFAYAHRDNQSGGTTFSDTYDCNNGGIEGTVAVVVFEDGS